jgi:class 3 adenylate cyclase
MFADMTGYTALIQANEQLAQQKQKRLKEVLEECIPEFGGEILQYYSDVNLSVFPSAIEATRAVVQIQLSLQDEPKVNSALDFTLEI